MKKSFHNLFLGIALTTSVSQALAVEKAVFGTELTDGASWGGTAPAATGVNNPTGVAGIAAWTATSLTGAQTVGSTVTWDSISLANTTALSVTGSQINLAGANTGGSFNVIAGSAAGTRSIANDLVLTGVNSNAVIAVGNITTRLQIDGGTNGGLTLGNITSNGGALANDANLFLRGSASNVVNGTLTVDGQLGKGDVGTWILNGSNSAGWVYANNGTLLAGNNGAFGSGTIYLGSGGGNFTLGSATSDARTFANVLDFTGGTGFVSTASLGQTTGGTGTLTFTGAVNLGTVARGINTNVDTTFSGIVSGAGGGITKGGNGTLFLMNANTLSGVTAINTGILALGNNGALGTSQLRLGGGTIASSDASARTIATSKQLDFAVSSNFGTAGTGNLLFTDTMNLGSLADKVATVNNSVTEFSGVISGAGADARIFTKAGTGNLILSGNNAYDRRSSVTEGTLTVGNVNAFGTATYSLTVTGGTLALGAFNINKAAIALNGGTLTGTAYTGAVNLGGNAAINGIFAGTLNTGTDAARTINTTGGLAVGSLTGQGIFSGGIVSVSTQLAPGNSLGTQIFNSGLSYVAGSALNVEIAADGSGADLLTVTGGLAIGSNASLSLSLFGTADYTTAFWDNSHNFAFLNADGITGDFANVSLTGLGDTSGQGVWSLDKDLAGAGGFTAVWTAAVPEPSAALLAGLGLLGLLRRRR